MFEGIFLFLINDKLHNYAEKHDSYSKKYTNKVTTLVDFCILSTLKSFHPSHQNMGEKCSCY